MDEVEKRAADSRTSISKRPWSRKQYYLTRRGKNVEISVKQVESYKTPVYISDKATIKPKALHEINQNTEKALSAWGVAPE